MAIKRTDRFSDEADVVVGAGDVDFLDLGTDTMQRIMQEEIEAPNSIPGEPDNEREFRKRVRKDIADIKATGGVVEIPPEWANLEGL